MTAQCVDGSVVEYGAHGDPLAIDWYDSAPAEEQQLEEEISVTAQIILQSAIASRNRITDERDRTIELRGYRAGYLPVASLMVVGLGILWLHTTAGNMHLDGRGWALHFLSVFFGILVISDITKTATQIVAYRKSP